MRIVSLLLWAALLCAQSYHGGIRGRVTDPAGAAVASAKVELIEDGTQLRRTASAGASGGFAFDYVKPGAYTVEVEATGFRKLSRRNVVVETQLTVNLDVALQLGAVTEVVEVTAQPPLIESANASTGQVLDQKRLADLPNQGRNLFIMVARMSPNVVSVANPRFLRMLDQTGVSRISIAGGPLLSNAFLLDGVPITDFNNRTSLIPSIEAVQEVKIQANTYDAEVGRTGGGVFNTYLKSGGNAFHGTGFFYLRDTPLFANDFFRNRAGQARPETPYRSYGASANGPVRIPRIYDGRNRTFFLAAFESFRQDENFTSEFAVPTAAEKNGDFASSRLASGAAVAIFDPLSTRVDGAGVVTREIFPGARIPASRLDAVGRNLARFFPDPTRTAAFYGGSNHTSSSIANNLGDQLIGKIDHQVTRWWLATISSARYQSEEPGAFYFGSVASPGNGNLLRAVNATQVNSVMTPAASTVVSLRWGYNRFPNVVVNAGEGFQTGDLGFGGNFLRDIQAQRFPGVTMQTFTGLGQGGGSSQFFYSQNLLGNAAHARGRHNYKYGFAFRQVNVDFVNTANAAGTFGFNDAFTRRDPSRVDGTGSDLASLLLGFPNGGSAAIATKLQQFIRYYGLYAHDDIRVTPRLTLNAGLRYEWEPGLAERQDRFIVGFDRQAQFPGLAGLRGTLLYAGVDGAGSTCCNPSKSKFSPRLGAAFQMNAKTVLRGGYGIFWGPVFHSGFNTPGYVATTDYLGSLDGNRTPAGTLSNPFPNGLNKPAGNSAGRAVGLGQSILFLDPESKSLYVHQYSLDVQRELPFGVGLLIGYVGTLSRNVNIGTGNININQLDPRLFSEGTRLFDLVENPYFGRGGAGVIAGRTVARNQLLRPFPQFGAVNLQMSSNNRARYDSLVMKAQRRFRAGFSFISTWTWSKNLDASFGAANQIAGQSGALPNAYDQDAEYGLSIADATHRFSNSFTWELPVGRGKAWLSRGGAADWVLGGWELNVVNIFQSGFPLAIIQNNNLNAAVGAAVQRPNATGISPATAGTVQERLDNYINPAAFSTAPQFTFGNVSRTIPVRAPGWANWDLALFKTFRAGEHFRAQFRAEALNALNTVQFNRPNVNFGNPTFGRITSQLNFPRFFQFGARFWF